MKKKLLVKTLTLLVAFVFVFSGSGSIVWAYDTNSKTATRYFTGGDRNFYDIDEGKTEGRIDVTDTNKLLKGALKSKYNKDTPSVLDSWTEIATGIIAANPQSYYSYGDEGNVGKDKGYQEFKKRFVGEMTKKSVGKYGDLKKALSSEAGYEKMSSDGLSYRGNDINLKASGLQSAANLNQVLERAYQSQVDINPGNISKDDFRKYNAIDIMANDKDKSGPVYYTMLSTRDRVGGTFGYYFNTIGLVFYDFNLQPVSGSNGEGVGTALGDMTLDEAKKKIEDGEKLTGFDYSSKATKAYTDVTNKGSQDTTQELTLNWSESAEISNSVTVNKQTSTTEEQSVAFHIGGDAFARVDLGFQFSETQLFEEGKTTGNTLSTSHSGSSAQTVIIPAHSVVRQVMKTEKQSVSESYDCPVSITYKVAIFSMCGNYYDDNAAVKKFTTARYQQRSFFSEIGSSKSSTSATANLKNRAIDNKGDFGFDTASAVTGGRAIQHVSTTPESTWQNPWVSYINWEDVERTAKWVDENQQSYSNAMKNLTENNPASISGGVIASSGQRVSGSVSEAVPIYALTKVALNNKDQDELTIKSGSSYKLANIKLDGIDKDSIPFSSFNAEKGDWKIVDEDGKAVSSSDVGEITTDKNDNVVFKAKAPGKVSIKYFVKENAYSLADNTKVDPSKVKTPTVDITVEKPKKGFGGKIEAPESVNMQYDKGKAVDLNSLKGLDVKIVDQNGNQMDADVIWSCRESNATIADNAMTTNEDGTYHIRASYEGVYSDWVTVNAAETAEVTQVHSLEEEIVQCADSEASFGEVLRAVKEKTDSGNGFFAGIADWFNDLFAGDDEETLAEIDEAEKEALIWAVKENILEGIDAASISTGHGVNGTELAIITYNAANEAGDIESYSKDTQEAIDWALSKGLEEPDDWKAFMNEKDVMTFIEECFN